MARAARRSAPACQPPSPNPAPEGAAPRATGCGQSGNARPPAARETHGPPGPRPTGLPLCVA
eukprot:6301650-Lingulodinium_polyedra.AAC.1